MMDKDITSLRNTLEFLRDKDGLLVIDGEVDPYLEVAGIIKAVDNSYTLLFQNIKGYPNTRIMAGLFSRAERVAQIFGGKDTKGLKLKGLEAIRNPIPPRLVDSGPCQEVVQTQNLDVLKSIPITQHTEADPGRILSGGIVLISEPDFGNCIAFKRIHFRGSDWASLMHVPFSHSNRIVAQYADKKRNLPITINISPPPSVMGVAGGGVIQAGIPLGSDELAIAGGLQGAPVEICKAKTVDAYAIASSEWVIEGYIDTSQVVWESEEAEKKEDLSTPFFPEFHGYVGRAQTTYKFQATAITGRKDNPIYNGLLAHSFESPYMQILTNRALQYASLHERWPSLIQDVNALDGMRGRFGLAIQVKKQSEQDDKCIEDIIQEAFKTATALKMVIVVDEDVDIYNADEVIWALSTRMNAGKDLMLIPPTEGPTGIRREEVGPFAPVTRMGFDATMPVKHKWEFYRGEYPEVNLEKWLTKRQIEKVRALQCDYAKVFASKRV